MSKYMPSIVAMNSDESLNEAQDLSGVMRSQLKCGICHKECSEVRIAVHQGVRSCVHQ